MRSNIMKQTSLIIMLLLATCLNTHAGDLDDGIEADDKIEAWDTIDRPGINIQYIKRRAKAAAAAGSGSGGAYYYGKGDIAIGSFINQPGAEVGDVTIIFDGSDINAVSE
jgi:hypothetical protein